MPHTQTKDVYYFAELSDRAKETARRCYRETSAEDFSDFGAESVLEDAARVCEILGVQLATRTVKLMGGGTRQEPVIYYSGFWSQGDGACFEGTYAYRKGSVRAIRAYAPKDDELARIASELREVQRANFYRLQASLTHRGRYSHANSVEITVEDAENPYRDLHGADETIAECLRDLMDWIYKALEQEYEYQTSDEVVDEMITANQYEFDEDGNRV